MSKLLSNTLERVSENNNEYRSILRSLNSSIDEKTTSLVGDIVTLSNYTADFSNTLTESKDKLVNPISRIIESYVIKDLRSVEMVNEQFVEKINDKLENTSITNKDEKDSFTNNLHNLLNNKYLEIVKIKRVDFTDENDTNADIEQMISEFIKQLKENTTFDENSLNDLFSSYKHELYALIDDALKQISNLYLNNFVSEVSSALSTAIDFDDSNAYTNDSQNDFKPFIPDVSSAPEIDIPVIPSIPEINEEPSDKVDNVSPIIPLIDDDKPLEEENKDVKPIDIEPIKPIEIKEEVEPQKRSYDVEEILKIAKSPIVAVPDKEEKNDSSYISVEPIVSEKDSDTIDSELSEREIVEEMINRLTKRLQAIDERRDKYKEEKSKLEEDQMFVNDLIESSKSKKEELDSFEQELNEKEIELSNKQKDLDKKINDVMPFANAILNTEKES